MAQQSNTKSYNPGAFVPTTSYTGSEPPLVIKGENMWLRFSRSGTIYAEGYTGNGAKAAPEDNIATKDLTPGAATIAWDSTSYTVTGTSTTFISDLFLGSFVLGDGGSGQSELFVVEKIVDDTHFIASRKPTTTLSGKEAVVLPVVFSIGTDRGTAIRGQVFKYPKGHYVGVGDGTFRINGTALTSTLALSKTPRFALRDQSAGTYTQDDVGIARPTTPITLSALTIDGAITGATNANPIVITVAGTHGLYTGQSVTISGVTGNTAANGTWTVTKKTGATFSIPVAGNGAYGGGGTIVGPNSQMRAGDYNVRVCSKSTSTLGFSNPTDVIAPVTLAAGQMIKVVFNSAMSTDQDAYDIYCSEFADFNTSTIEKRYMGPWYLVTTATAAMLVDDTYTTGRASGASFAFSFSDAEIVSSDKILTFDNFTPKKAGTCDLINGILVYFSCLGQGNSTDTDGTSPGPAAVPSKPDNPEAVLLDKALTTCSGDTIIGAFNAKARNYTLCQNSLQTIILTTLDEEPIAFRSLWNTGFRNPYNVAFVKEYLYSFSNQKFVRSVAGGDDSAMEFEYASDVRDYANSWETGHVLVAYDPKNRAVIHFYAAAERRNGYWVTIALPFLLDKQVWNPPIILSKTNTDFIVSGVATIGADLVFLAGGRTSGGSISVGTYVFDGGDSESKSWYMAWNYSDDGLEFNPKTLKGFTVTGRFADNTNTKLKVYGVKLDGTFDFSSLAAGTNSQFSYPFGSTGGNIMRKRFRFADAGSYPIYTIRMEGVYTTTADRLDEVACSIAVNNSET